MKHVKEAAVKEDLCSGVGPTLNVPPADERAYPCESTNELLIVCSSAKLLATIDLINLDVAGY